MTTGGVTLPEGCNEVRLIGRIPATAEERVLPGGDVLCTFRVAIHRQAVRDGSSGVSLQRVDSLECVTWNGRVRRSAMSWTVGGVVEVSGSLRRRFFKTAAGTGSRVEVDVTSGRRLRRAGA